LKYNKKAQLSLTNPRDAKVCLYPSAAEYPPNSPKKTSLAENPPEKMRLAENPPNRKLAAAAEKNRGYCGAFNTTGCCSL